MQLEQIRDFSHNQLKSGQELSKKNAEEQKKNLVAQWGVDFLTWMLLYSGVWGGFLLRFYLVLFMISLQH